METHKQGIQAAPPDAAGHRGSETLPGDTLTSADQDEERSPALHSDPAHRAGDSQSFPWMFWAIILGTLGIGLWTALGR